MTVSANFGLFYVFHFCFCFIFHWCCFYEYAGRFHSGGALIIQTSQEFMQRLTPSSLAVSVVFPLQQVRLTHTHDMLLLLSRGLVPKLWGILLSCVYNWTANTERKKALLCGAHTPPDTCSTRTCATTANMYFVFIQHSEDCQFLIIQKITSKESDKKKILEIYMNSV